MAKGITAYVRIKDRQFEDEWTKIVAIAGDIDLGHCEKCDIDTPHYITFHIGDGLEMVECWNCATDEMDAPVIGEAQAKEMGIAS